MIIHFTPDHHFTSLHFTTHLSPFFTSGTFVTAFQQPLHISSLIITFLALFLKICDLQWKVTSATAGSSFHISIVKFTKEFLPIYTDPPPTHHRLTAQWAKAYSTSRLRDHTQTHTHNR